MLIIIQILIISIIIIINNNIGYSLNDYLAVIILENTCNCDYN